MTLTRLDESSCGMSGTCPALFMNAAGQFVVQGSRTEGEDMAPHETAVEVPPSILLPIGAGKDAPMSHEDFGALFHTFRQTAFRLEVLSRYSVDAEAELFRQFLACEELTPIRDLEAGRIWIETIAHAVTQGKRWQKVHLIRGPLTDYLRFELWVYEQTAAAGENIGIIHVQPGEVPELGRDDFWLFDDELAVRLLYDREGRFIGPVAVTGPEVNVYRYRRDAALRQAIPLATYLEAAPSRVARTT